MKRFFIKLSYNGTSFHGWQRQENAHSVQENIENKLSIIFQNRTEILGCGRTDSGVHARMYYAHFDTDLIFDNTELTYKLNCMLPKSIAIQEIIPVIKTAHARFDATARSYEYHISKNKDPFATDLVYEFNYQLDIEAMNSAAELLLNTVDFKSFCKTGSDAKTTNCNVQLAKWVEKEGHSVFNITADRFLRNMVRAIVGTLMDVGMGKLTKEEFEMIITARDRSKAKSSAPAAGLYLTKVVYPENIFL